MMATRHFYLLDICIGYQLKSNCSVVRRLSSNPSKVKESEIVCAFWVGGMALLSFLSIVVTLTNCRLEICELKYEKECFSLSVFSRSVT